MLRHIIKLLVFAHILTSSAAWAGIVVIVNPSVIETTVTPQDLKLIYLGKKIKWQGGQKIRPVRLLKGDAHAEFIEKYVGKTPASYIEYWRQAFITGSGIPPKVMLSEKQVILWVANNEGAIGYISDDVELFGRVKVLNIGDD